MNTKKFNTRYLSMLAVVVSLHLIVIEYSYALDINASLQWSRRVELGTPVSGVITSAQANPGDRVKHGDLLIKLDERNYVAALLQAKAREKDLSEKRKEAQRQLRRAQELYDRTVLSEHDLQTAKNRKVEADSEYEMAKSELVTAELNLEYTSIRAPFDAMVISRHVEPGQTVVSQLKPETMVIVAAAGEMVARGQIDQSQLDGQLQGRPAQVVAAGLRYEGKVKYVGLEPVKTDKQGIYYEIAVVFNTGERILRAGQQVTIKLP
ncbi:MAG: efflux RND transporter periplasmic adaptor subunit [Gammaproteobacteria bacterium]|nr:efflux RND transporter periplasmic adaptor subunit [Gammaproteobacteria bacterium]